MSTSSWDSMRRAKGKKYYYAVVFVFPPDNIDKTAGDSVSCVTEHLPSRLFPFCSSGEIRDAQ